MNHEQAVDEILDMFRVAWQTTGHQAFYEQVREDRNSAITPWAEVFIRHSGGFQGSIGEKGHRKFVRIGFIRVTIQTPAVFGLSSRYQLAKVVADAYEGKSSASGGVWFRNVRINEGERDGMFYGLNVIVDFQYHETK